MGIIRFKIYLCAVTQTFTIVTVIAEYINYFDINPQVVAWTTKIRHAISSVDELACTLTPTYTHTHTKGPFSKRVLGLTFCLLRPLLKSTLHQYIFFVLSVQSMFLSET